VSADGRDDAPAAVAEELRRHLAWLADAGVREIPPPPARVADAAPAPAEVAPAPSHDQGEARTRSGGAPARAPTPSTAAPAGDTRPPARAPTAAPVAPSAGGAHGLDDRGCGSPGLLQVREELGACERCKLGRGRTKLVFGVGSPHAELMFVGEGPGEDEDLQGEPFVGRAGQLLTKMIEAMGFARADVYIANVVKCRPPGNRNPEPDEIEACEPFLRAQISAVRPRVIVALGKFAAQTLLRDTSPISRLRGRWFAYEGVKLMPTFHPAYLLRSPNEKAKAWDDLQLVMKELGKAPPRR
jgi:DNA polymerase